VDRLGIAQKQTLNKTELLQKEIDLLKLQAQAKDEELERMKVEMDRMK
jgi:hypothetical protein